MACKNVNQGRSGTLALSTSNDEVPVAASQCARTCVLNTVKLARYLCVIPCSVLFFPGRLVPSRRELVRGLRVSMALFLVTSVECGLLIVSDPLVFPSLGIRRASCT